MTLQLPEVERRVRPLDVQPAKLVLVARRITQRRAAAVLGISEHFLGRCLNGQVPASPRVRAGLSALLGVPPEELFR